MPQVKSNTQRVNDAVTRRRFLLTSALAATSILLESDSPVSAHPAATAQFQNVIVVGAGISGIAAAAELARQNIKVVVLEGRDRVGGRIWTDTSMGSPVELGASWIESSRGNPLTPLARHFGLKSKTTNYTNLDLHDTDGHTLSKAEVSDLNKLYEEFNAKLQTLQAGADTNLRVSDAINQILAESNYTVDQLRGLQFAIQYALVSDNGADMDEMSLKDLNEANDFDGPDLLVLNGYNRLVQGLARGLDVRLNQTVTNVTAAQDGVKVTTETDAYYADAAVITLPLGVLKSGKVTFDPPLSERKQQALNNLNMAVLNKFAMKFPSSFWPAKADFCNYILPLNQSGIFEFLDMSHYNKQPILVAFNAGSFGESLEKMSVDDQTVLAMKTLRTMYGASIPDPVSVVATAWKSDPFALGSYSNTPPGSTNDDFAALGEPEGSRLFFAGEATHTTYNGSVHGAYITGLREANRIITGTPQVTAGKKSAQAF